jgi:PHD/YefM family antitoxin component YafN of YafNO toxin-antitoxin module
MKVNALQIRQGFGSILSKLKKSNQPIVIEKNREPVAVLLPIELYNKRFLDYLDRDRRDELLSSFAAEQRSSNKDSLTELRKLRYG